MSSGLIKRRDLLSPGDLVLYGYRWAWEDAQGCDTPCKVRPCVVAAKMYDGDKEMLALLPITTQPARDPSERLIVPHLERADVGMDPQRPQSIAIRDINIEPLKGSERLRKLVRHWTFSEVFTDQIVRSVKENFDAGITRLVMRRHDEVYKDNDMVVEP